MPNEFQNTTLHEKLRNTAAFQKVKTTLTKRDTTKRVWITLNGDTLKEYKDDEGNIYFNNYLLEEQIKDIKAEQLQTPATGISEKALQQILENVTKKNEQKSKIHNLRKISEKLVIEKFTGKNANAPQWMEILESEFWNAQDWK